MNTKQIFRVAMIGLTIYERQMLKSIAGITAKRDTSYEFHDFNAAFSYDVIFVDLEFPEAMEIWRNGPHRGTVVLIASTDVEGQRCLKRPIMGARLLTLLDDVTSQLDMAPPAKNLALVVDDSPTVRTHIKQGLAPFDLEVHFAETGEQALDRLAENTYDIVFLDVVLPGIDGYDVCKAIKKDRELKATPVIMLTSKSSPFDRIKGSLAGCDTYLTKPVEYDHFKEVVKKHLGATLGVMPVEAHPQAHAQGMETQPPRMWSLRATPNVSPVSTG